MIASETSLPKFFGLSPTVIPRMYNAFHHYVNAESLNIFICAIDSIEWNGRVPLEISEPSYLFCSIYCDSKDGSLWCLDLVWYIPADCWRLLQNAISGTAYEANWRCGGVAGCDYYSEHGISAAFITGFLWLLLDLTGAAARIANWVPRYIVTGIVLGLGLGFMHDGIHLMSSARPLAVVGSFGTLLLLTNKIIPAMFVLLIVRAVYG
jgi:hypothetical protein